MLSNAIDFRSRKKRPKSAEFEAINGARGGVVDDPSGSVGKSKGFFVNEKRDAKYITFLHWSVCIHSAVFTWGGLF